MSDPGGAPAAGRAIPHGGDGSAPAPGAIAPLDLEARIARVLMLGTYLSVALIAAGVALMVAYGISPLDAPPPLVVGDVLTALGRIRPEGLLALGLVAMVFTPTARVVASLVGYLEDGERQMAFIAVGILGVIVLSVVLALGLEG